MDTADILRVRLRALLIEGSSATTPHDVISHLLAMQAQDYSGALWAVGLRLPGSTLVDVEAAIAEHSIVRTWPMRGTLHFVAAEDARWLLPLLAPRILSRAASRERQLGIDAPTIARARELFSAALEGGRLLARPEALAMLEANGVTTTGQRGYHILWRFAQEGLLVLGPMRGRQQTFALLDEWVPAEKSAYPPDAPREELLGRLAARYFASHGPATAADLARWAGIAKREAAGALAEVADELESAEHDGVRYWFAPEIAEEACGGDVSPGPDVHLLPGFDEYLLGYTVRSHQLGDHLATYGGHVASNGMFAPTVVAEGRVVGIWKRRFVGDTVSFAVTEFEKLSRAARAGIVAEQHRYARFFGRRIAEG